MARERSSFKMGTVEMMALFILSSFKMGTVEMMALFILSKGDFYGYQIASLIGKLTDGKVTVPESTLYPTLYKLLDRKLISDKTVPLGKNRVRVFYHLEEEGWQRLNDLLEDYRNITEGISQLLAVEEIDEEEL